MSEIVVGYDGSDCGKAALEEALRLAKGLSDNVVIVFGYAPPGLWGGEIVEHEEAIEELGVKLTSEARRQSESSGVETEVEMVAKRPPEALVDVAESRRARMIVVGSYGDPPLRGVILGSTPNKLLHIAKCPVLIVPADEGV
jgi:nucleotide-binding universal stress UspA family protein